MHTRNDRHGFLDRARHGEHDLACAQGRAFDDDRDARKEKLGIDRRRQPRRGPDAGEAHERDREIDEAPLRTQEIEKRQATVSGISVRARVHT